MYACKPASTRRVVALETFPALVRTIEGAVDEGGLVRDSASEHVRGARAACATLDARLRRALAKLPGDITTHSGRLCVVVPTGAHVLARVRSNDTKL
jgi:dsDNA-specific endonuclease/ATPase MutS2